MLQSLLLKFDSIKKKGMVIERAGNGLVLEIVSGRGDEDEWRGQVI